MNHNVNISKQTFFDLSTWLTHPDEYSQEQLSRLLYEDKYLPLIALAHEYWLIGALTNQLKHANVWDKLSTQFKGYLIEIERIYYNRINAIKTEACNVTSLLVDANIDVIVMKGAASLFNGVAEPVSNRYMKDIDILVPEKLQQAAYNVLKNHGYIKDKNYYDLNACDAHHAPPLIKNNLCYIELHRWVLVKHLNKILDTKTVWEQTVPLNLTGNLTVNQLNPSHQIILSIAHSEIQNGGYDQKHIDLHQLLNLFSIASYYAEQIDWIIVKQHFHKSDQLPILTATLYKLLILFQFKTPITDSSCILAIKHFNCCLSRYVKHQGAHTHRSVFMEQLYGYKKRNIYLMYGNHNLFSYSKGVMKHLYYHLRKALSLQHVKPYLSRMLNKS